MLRNNQIRKKVKEIDDFIEQVYKPAHPAGKRDWKTYEQRLAHKIKYAVTELRPLISEAVSTIHILPTGGRPHALSVEQRLTLIILQRIFGKSNRKMECMLALFIALSGIDVSYKTVERLYSDDETLLALSNLHHLILKKRNIRNIDACGDATGYGLTISKHYATEAARLKEEGKVQDSKKKFVFAFQLLDLKTKLYIAYGTSFKSEKESFEQARIMLKKLNINIESIRLDRYYSNQSDVDKFPNAKVYIIPKTNVTLKGSWHWKRTLFKFYNDTIGYVEEYFKRNSSENGFGIDKREFGWRLPQKREDRIDTSIFCITILHNLFNFQPDQP